jgi:hypothetical protein
MYLLIIDSVSLVIKMAQIYIFLELVMLLFFPKTYKFCLLSNLSILLTYFITPAIYLVTLDFATTNIYYMLVTSLYDQLCLKFVYFVSLF